MRKYGWATVAVVIAACTNGHDAADEATSATERGTSSPPTSTPESTLPAGDLPVLPDPDRRARRR
jgi:hypothetical protein